MMKRHFIIMGLIGAVAMISVACAGTAPVETPTKEPTATATSASGETPTSGPTETPAGEPTAAATSGPDSTLTKPIQQLTEGFRGVKDLVERVVGEPPEATAKFLPADTLVYFTVNREPGAGQLAKAREIKSIFEGVLPFESEREEALKGIEEQFGINVLDDFYDWIGSDLTFALLDVREDPHSDCCSVDWIVLVRTKDRAASELFLDDLVLLLEDQEFLEFEKGPLLRDGIVYVEEDEAISFGLTGEYALIASSSTVARDIARNLESPPLNPLSEDETFQRVAGRLPSERFLLAFVRGQDTYKDLKQGADPYYDYLGWLKPRRYVPEAAGVSATFIDQGFRVDLYSDTPPGVILAAVNNPLSMAGLLPQDTLFAASGTGLEEAWEQARNILEEVSGSGARGLDRGLNWLAEATGVDAERDIIRELSGEIVLAVLPSRFRLADDVDFISGAIEVAAMAEIGDSAGAKRALEELVDRLDEEEGVRARERSVGEYEAVFLDLSEQDVVEVRGFSPGYLFTDELIVMSSTLDAMFRTMDSVDGTAPALSSNARFSELTKLAPYNASYIVFADIAGLVDMVVACLPSDTRASYEDNIRPSLVPLDAFFAAATSNDEFTLLTLALTFSKEPREAAAVQCPPAPPPTPRSSRPTPASPRPVRQAPTVEPVASTPASPAPREVEKPTPTAASPQPAATPRAVMAEPTRAVGKPVPTPTSPRPTPVSTPARPAPTPTPASTPTSPSPTAKPVQVTPTPAVRYGGVLHLVIAVEPFTLDPSQLRQRESYQVISNIYSTLVRMDDRRPPATPHIAPDLAKWGISADYLDWTFHLREGATWHDGQPLSAEDVSATLVRIMTRPDGISSTLARHLEPITSVQSIDDMTVRLRTREPMPYLLPVLAHPQASIVPGHVVQADQRGLEQDPIGSGPFQLSTWRKGESLELDRAQDYRVEGLPYLDRLSWFVIPDAATRVATSLTHQTHVTSFFGRNELGATEINRLTGSRIRVDELPSLANLFVLFNTTGQVFGDQNVRQAVLHSIDGEGFAEVLLSGGAFNSDFNGPLGLEWSLRALPGYDPERARQHLAEAGYPDGFKAEVMVLEQQVKELQVIASHLKAVGIDVQLRVLEVGEWVTNLRGLDYRMTLVFRGGSVYDPALQLERFTTGSSINFMGFSDPRVDELYERVKAEVDPARRKLISDEIQHALYQLAPAIPLPNSYSHLAVAPGVEGVSAPTIIDDGLYLERAWLN